MKVLRDRINKNLNQIDSSIIINVQSQHVEKGIKYYPCLCEAAKLVFLAGKLGGVSPIITASKGPHTSGCQFIVSKKWLTYSYIIQLIYVPYILATYSSRISCGPNTKNILQWYVMTFGYFITDLDSMSSLATGSFFAKKTCVLLQKLSTIPESIIAMQYLKQTLQKFLLILMSFFLAVFLSYAYVAFLRVDYLTSINNMYCNLLDLPYAVVLRGTTIIFPTIELANITMLCLLIKTKFHYLSDKTASTLDLCYVAPSSGGNIPDQLNRLAHDHKQITYCLKQINSCTGLQILVATSSCLYTTIYYLYRYSTSYKDTIGSNAYEQVHYIIGLSYRIAKLLLYMTLGQQVTSSSLQPLRVLQEAQIINLPFRLQQQVQTLILQWSGRQGSISALGVIRMGPWLLGPIVGSIITYLLVALQFESTANVPTNVTAILESFF